MQSNMSIVVQQTLNVRAWIWQTYRTFLE